MAPNPGRTRMVNKTLAALLAIRVEQLAQAYGDLGAFQKKAGISPGTYYILIRGDGNPTLDTIEMIAKGLGMSVWDLLGLDTAIVKSAVAEHGIDLDAIEAANKARAKAFAKLDGQRVQGKKAVAAKLSGLKKA
ncbi:MAG: helix-turn-helix domain-containing protein [Proteobacteria bacterium]|nr:helix-turn-helix domain-containing protein [Pseudomonadota bacterium]